MKLSSPINLLILFSWNNTPSLYATNPFSEKIALIGDAAHTIHPLAGQGFNLSIEDCFDLLKCIDKASSYGKDFGDISILNEYGNLRKKRNNLITLITTSIFYLFKKRTRTHCKIIWRSC